jgi:hypothetical protein
MSAFNLDYTHPLIPNSNEYLFEKKYVSISSEDRNVIKYPNAGEFEIELPQDYLNVQHVKLVQWAFPSNYDVFSAQIANLGFAFQMTSLYDPSSNGVTDPLQLAIYQGLESNLDFIYSFTIESGFYNPIQMATELTNKLNFIITTYLTAYLKIYYPSLVDQFIASGYSQFVVVYDSVGQKLWFGNKSSGFIIINNGSTLDGVRQLRDLRVNTACIRKNELPDFTSWGLPSYLGFVRCDAPSQPGPNPRFYYGDYIYQNNGYWLVPDLSGANVQYLAAPLKINFMGPAYYYMEIDGLNCIDETSPYNVSSYTVTTNGTNGRVNACFAKIPVVDTPIAQFFDREAIAYKWFNPPAERIRKLKIRIRYHNGAIVQFGNFNYSFLLQFGLMNPQQKRVANVSTSFGV